jgi:transitional endoplasmic reticulum ATPase
VQITRDTQIELLPQYVEPEEPRQVDVTYDDVGGVGETVEQPREMVELPLRHPELFQRLGIDPPKGVLLHGPPGTGKTLLVRAVANESEARFFHIAGPEIMGRYYGESEERLRSVFQEAQRDAPAVIFIDEIDSIAPKREETGEVERRVVAQLLTLMDGLEPRQNVIVIGATNRVDALDEALRRYLPELKLDGEAVPSDVLETLVVEQGDFEDAFTRIQPSALREIMVQVPDVSWDDIGGLEDVRQSLTEAIELPMKFPDTFKRVGIRPAKGLLFFGTTGYGEDVVGQGSRPRIGGDFIAAESSSLLSKWYGESEKQVAKPFQRARQVAPTVVLLDEIDSLAPQRGTGSGEPAVTERVVNSLLAELDGLEELQGVLVIGATNRPMLLDNALLRPGRFDELVYVPVPDTA